MFWIVAVLIVATETHARVMVDSLEWKRVMADSLTWESHSRRSGPYPNFSIPYVLGSGRNTFLLFAQAFVYGSVKLECSPVQIMKHPELSTWRPCEFIGNHDWKGAVTDSVVIINLFDRFPPRGIRAVAREESTAVVIVTVFFPMSE